jgi:hypothetical protein
MAAGDPIPSPDGGSICCADAASGHAAVSPVTVSTASNAGILMSANLTDPPKYPLLACFVVFAGHLVKFKPAPRVPVTTALSSMVLTDKTNL